MDTVIVRSNGQQLIYDPPQFWSLCIARQFLRSDQIFDWVSGQFLYAGQFVDVEPYLPPRGIGEIIEDILAAVRYSPLSRQKND